MLIVGTWGALLLYIISWISGLFPSPFDDSSSLRFKAWTELTGMRLGWVIHTVVLLGLLWTKSVWPSTFVSDILNVAAWASMVGVQAFPERLPSLVNTSIVRFFVILLLGLSLIISQNQVSGSEIVSAEPWLYQVLLGTHIIILLAGYAWSGLRGKCYLSISRAPSQNKTSNLDDDSFSCARHTGSS